MRIFATRLRGSLPILALTTIFALTAGHAHAQINPLWDHYKVYNVDPKPPDGRSVLLTDQFFAASHIVLNLDLFANPVEKVIADGTHFPINDPLLHYTWWRISDVPHGALVAARNQFGDHTLTVGRPLYLLNPALKNQAAGQELPPRNHYRCYECQGDPVDRPVTLTDQFDTWTTIAVRPVFFCNPAQKQEPGRSFPIVDPAQHYICYTIEPPDPGTFTSLIQDQFIPNTAVAMTPGIMLCVPTEKTGVTATRIDTWGRVKQLYR